MDHPRPKGCGRGQPAATDYLKGHMTESEVMTEVRKILMRLEYSGDIIIHERMNSGRIKTEYGSWMQLCRKGTPDWICLLVNKRRTLSCVWIECKSSIGKLSAEQIDFRDRYTNKADVHYFVISDPSELTKKILEIGYDRLSAINF